VDFRKASNHFADPDFDGEMVQIDGPGEDDDPLPPEISGAPHRNYYIKGKPVRVLTERIECLDANGKLVTESLRGYSRKTLREPYASRRRSFLFSSERLQKLGQTNQCPCMAPNWQG
jgi:type I restriction enzyme R subunit